MSEKIILVDDDSNILASVSMALKAEGWLVETYNDSEQALVALQKNSPDLAVKVTWFLLSLLSCIKTWPTLFCEYFLPIKIVKFLSISIKLPSTRYVDWER